MHTHQLYDINIHFVWSYQIGESIISFDITKKVGIGYLLFFPKLMELLLGMHLLFVVGRTLLPLSAKNMGNL